MENPPRLSIVAGLVVNTYEVCMVCYYPMSGYMRQDKCGRRFTMSTPRRGAEYTVQTVPCGQCTGCRMDRARQWATRCMHEASLWSRNCFITLTYNDEHLPENGSLVYDDFQKFMKRLRFSAIGIDSIVDDDGKECWPIRFYMAGEYGEKFGRPHFHACIFNFDFDDKYDPFRSPSGELLYRSKKLEELWPYGFSSVGTVTWKSAAYVARYIMKKVIGKQSVAHYGDRVPEFNKMSLKPGIGARWYRKFPGDVHKVDADGNVHQDFVLVDGKPSQVPRYYDKLFAADNLASFEAVQFGRYERSRERLLKDLDAAAVADLPLAEYSDSRLKVKEEIALKRLSMLKRTI